MIVSPDSTAAVFLTYQHLLVVRTVLGSAQPKDSPRDPSTLTPRLRCPFGCREHHRRQQANARSRKHYDTSHGRRKKKHRNGKRSVVGRSTPGAEPSARDPRGGEVSSFRLSGSREQASPAADDRAHTLAALVVEEAPREDVKLALDGFTLDEVTLVNSPVLPYLAMIATVLEGRTIGIPELLQVLRRSMRQRIFDRLPRREYVLRFLHPHPP